MPGSGLRRTLLTSGKHGGSAVGGTGVDSAEYYRFLAGTLPVADLGQVAWRRLRRAVLRQWRTLQAPIDGFTTFDLARAMRLACLDDFAMRMRGVRAARGAIEPNERAEARRIIQTDLPGHAREVCERADRVLSGELFLFGRWRGHSRGDLAPGVAAVDWRRDPLHGGLAPDRPSQEIDRDAVGTDSRAVWEAARLAHVYWLAQAHTVVGLPGTETSQGAAQPGLYARAIALHVRDFLATQPLGRGIHWTCPMEAALRVLHLAPALSLVRDAPELDALFWAEAAQLLWQHGRFIEQELEDTQAVPNNHLLTDLAGLCVLGCLFPELPGALEWRESALTAFGTELLRQTAPDGFSFEASTSYHRYTTELGLVVQATARRQGLSLGAPVLGRLWRMCDAVERATLSDGRLANVGDNDSSRAMSAVLRPALDGAHVPAVRAAIGGPCLHVTIEPEALWFGGTAGFRRAREHALEQRSRTRRASAKSQRAGGLVVLRQGSRAVSLWAGDNGQQGLGGHAHNDKLASEIVLAGRRLVVDPGCPVYVSDPQERDRYRRTGAHPTVEVDGQEQAPIPLGRPFLLPEAAQARVLEVGPARARGEHRGYERLRPRVVHRREVVLPARMHAVCVTDHLLGAGAHIADVHWPLTLRDVSIREANTKERALLDRLEALEHGEGRYDPARVVVFGDESKPFALLAIASESPWEVLVSESAWSAGYGERTRARSVRVRVRGQLPVVVTSCFVSLAPVR